MTYLGEANAQRLHLPAKFAGIAMEDNTGHTGAFGTFDVLGGIVDKQAFLGNETEGLIQQTVDFRFRLDQLHIGGNQRSVEVLTEQIIALLP